MKANILVAGVAALSLAACTTTNPFTGEERISSTAAGAGIGAVGGAVGGLIVGGATGGDPRIGALIGAGVGALAGAGIGAYMDQQEAALRSQLQGTGVSVTRVGNQIVLNMPANITFAVGSSEVNPNFRSTLISVGLVLEEYEQTILDVYGHTDSTGSTESNQTLSEQRALAVANIIAAQGIDSRRFYIEGRGETQPIATNDTENGRAQNRRVEIQISPLTRG